ncbi:hypothetical protein ABFS82_14G119900 [Erythranthe guttata]
MENGIGIAEDAKLREMSVVASKVVEPIMNKTVDLGSDESQCSDGDEVFEEAVEAETPYADSVDSIMTRIGNVDLIFPFENNEGNLDALHEFEEVIGGPAVVSSSEDAGAKTEILTSEEKQIASEKIVGGETNGLVEDIVSEENGSAIEDGKNLSTEIVGSAAIAAETVNLNDGNEKSDESNQRPVGVISEKLSSMEDNVAENNDSATEEGENQCVEVVDSAAIADETENLNDGNEKLDESTVGVISNEVSHIEDSDSATEDGKSRNTEIVDLAAIGDETSNLNDEHEKLDESIQNPVNVISDQVSHFEDRVADNGDSAIDDVKNQHVESVNSSVSHIEDRVADNGDSAIDDGKNQHVESVDSSVSHIENRVADNGDSAIDDGKNQHVQSVDSSVIVDETLNLNDENEMFDESVQNPVNVILDKASRVEDSVAEDSDSAIEDGKLHNKETVDSTAVADETASPDDENEKLDEPNEKPVGVISNKMSYAEALTSGDVKIVDADNKEALISEMPKTQESNELSRDVTEPEKLDIETEHHEITENQDCNKVNGGEIESNLPENGSLDHVSMVGTLNHEDMPSVDSDALKEQVQEDTDVVKASESVTRAAFESNGDALHKNEDNGILASGNQHEKHENHSADLSEVQKDEVMELEENSREADDSRDIDHEENSGIAAAETSKLGSNLQTAFEDSTPKPEIAETPRSSQPQLVDSSSEVSTNIVENVAKVQEPVTHGTTPKLEQEIKPVTAISSAANSTTPPPAGLGNTAPLLDHGSQNKDRWSRTVADNIPSTNITSATPARPAGQDPLDFTCTIMVLGKSGVGKSATINSIFDEVMFGTDAFQLGTKKVQDIVGTVQGIRVRVIDTPGLFPSWSDQRQNEKILHSVKRFIKKTPPDIVLYLDRLDMQSRDMGDMPLLRTITDIFGQSIWFNAIVVLTHAASAPPEGPNGTTTSYDMFVTQRSHVVQQAIRQAAGDMRLMNPVSLVENHSACRTNRAGQRVLPNGQVWKPHLLLLSFASKILAEANTLLKLADSPPGRPFAPRTRSPPLPSLLPSLLQSRPEVKLPSEQFGDDDDAVDDDLDECSDSEGESEYDALPPFRSLTKAQLENLSKQQKKAYYDELEYREKLFMKKQLKEERKRRKMMKKMQEAAIGLPADYGDNGEEEASAAASVPVPMPDLALPASFDSDNPTHRYRSLDSSNPWLVRAVLEPNGWDHDIGYDGINVERLFVLDSNVPVSFSGHISKDKKDASLQMEMATSVKHGKGKATTLGFDMQPFGKDYAYTLRSDTRFISNRVNKAAAGLSTTVLGDILTGGVKLEDKLTIGKRGQLLVSGGAIYGRGEVAYGGSLEATLRDKEHPLGRFLSTLGISVMDWHGDLAVGCNSQTQIPIGRHTNLIGRFNLNNRGSGQLSLKVNSSEQLQIVLIGLIPLVQKVLGYSQQVQYG